MSEIRMVIQKESDLYNPFDPETINDDVISFIIDRADEVRLDLNLLVVSDAPIDTERLKKALHSYVVFRKKKLDMERRLNLFRQLRLFIIGMAFITVWLAISAKTEGIWPEVLSIFGSFAVWEAAKIWLVDNPNLRARKVLLRLLENIEITCSSVQ